MENIFIETAKYLLIVLALVMLGFMVVFVAYEFKSKIQVNESFDRDKLFVWLEANIVEIKRRICEKDEI